MANPADLEPATRQASDYVIGGLGVTSPVWLDWLHLLSQVAAVVAALGGAVLVILRIMIALRELRNKRRADCETED